MNCLSILRIDIAINAEVIYSESFSSHADQEDLLHWIQSSSSGKMPEKIFLVHGETESKIELEKKIEAIGISTHIPKKGEIIDLS